MKKTSSTWHAWTPPRHNNLQGNKDHKEMHRLAAAAIAVLLLLIPVVSGA